MSAFSFVSSRIANNPGGAFSIIAKMMDVTVHPKVGFPLRDHRRQVRSEGGIAWVTSESVVERSSQWRVMGQDNSAAIELVFQLGRYEVAALHVSFD
ncbi:hypothetical protein LJR030_005128 [Rhizobium sp. LjRoot30]|uniref:hypothetical protein n=1 Tax=Rhizobium sp. LjRoot30 TaxID=3342320 RepID=UPI003ECE115C